MQKIFSKKLFVSEIIVSELLPLNCIYQEGITCQQKSMFSQTVLRFCISLRETSSNSVAFSGIKKYCKEAIVHIPTVFWPIY